MGLYQTVDLMAANGFLDGFNRTDNTITALPIVKYIYKLTCTTTGHFYIGQSHSLKDRIYNHIRAISDHGKENTRNTSAVHFNKTVGPLLMPAYQEWSLPGKKKKPDFEFYVRRCLSVYIYSLCGDQQTADLVETFYIKQFIKDPLCLNLRPHA